MADRNRKLVKGKRGVRGQDNGQSDGILDDFGAS